MVKGKGYSFSKSDYLFRPTKNPSGGGLNKKLSSKAVGVYDEEVL